MSATDYQFPLPGGASKKPFPAARTAYATKLLPLLLLLALAAVVQAQYYFTTNKGTITITGYYGSGGAVVIPGTILVGGINLPVTCIGDYAFEYHTNLTNVTVPDTVITIGDAAFEGCTGLTSVTDRKSTRLNSSQLG